MADGLGKSGHVRLHQALHGYADGHRLLACSASLKGRDAKTMLILTDISGPGAQLDDGGYLTGYPLPESGLYALGRTWAAPEMPRPGCVWTHTLLVDFADLAGMLAPNSLVTAFHRPSVGEAVSDRYGIPLEVRDGDRAARCSEPAVDELVREMLWRLYGEPKSRIVLALSSKYELEPWVLALWSQQWPRLRRSFRFCTLSFADRSTDAEPFDLQLIPPNDRSVRARFPTLANAEAIPRRPVPWIEAAIGDLKCGGAGELRAFLHRAGGDVGHGREAFAPLCQLHALLVEARDRPGAIEEAIATLDGSPMLLEANVAKTSVARAAFACEVAPGEAAIDFVLRHSGLIDEGDWVEHGKRFGYLLWSFRPDKFAKLFDGIPPQQRMADETIGDLSHADLLEGIRRAPELQRNVLARRFDIVLERDFWRLERIDEVAAFRAASESSERMGAALTAMIDSEVNDLALKAVQHFGTGPVFRSVAAYLDRRGSEEVFGSGRAWLSSAVIDTAAVADALSSRSIAAWATLVAIARVTDPDSIPNEFGDDPWLTAAGAASGELSEQGRVYLSAYLLARALGQRSRNQAELISLTFDDVYVAASESRLPAEAWRLLESRLPSSRLWFEWDRCQRLRIGAVDAFVDRGLSAFIFGNVTSNDGVFAQLAEAAAWKWGGRTYLRDVRRSLKDADRGRYAQRIDIIGNAL